MARKKYSINWENDEPISFEVDGVSYESIEQVPDEEDREKLTAMMDAPNDASLDQQFEKEFKDFDKELRRTGKLTRRILPVRRKSSSVFSPAFRY